MNNNMQNPDLLVQILDRIVPLTPKPNPAHYCLILNRKNGIYSIRVTWNKHTRVRTLQTTNKRTARALSQKIMNAIQEAEQRANKADPHVTEQALPSKAAHPHPPKKPKTTARTDLRKPKTSTRQKEEDMPVLCYSLPFASARAAAEELDLRLQTVLRLCREEKYGWKFDKLI